MNLNLYDKSTHSFSVINALRLLLSTTLNMVLWIFLVLALGLTECNGARILAFLPMGSHSHQNTYRPIFRRLAKLGHDITYVTSLPDEKAPYKQIVVPDPFVRNLANDMDLFEMRKNTWLSDLLFMIDVPDILIPSVLSSPEVQKLITSTELHFDLVFTEATLSQEAYIMFGYKFRAPVIELTGLCPPFWLYHLIGNPYSFSFTVSYLTLSSDKMNFIERLRNTVIGIANLLLIRYHMLPKQEALVNQYFNYPGSETRPPLIDMLSNISLVLQNTHIANHYAHPYNPNVIEISGIQLQELQEPKTLSQELQRYLDDAKEGVIYFSLGSVVNASLMPETTRQAFVSAFEKLPYKILWKWEVDFLPNQPENVKISKWLPQKDILSHHNVKTFITHGGLASMTEAIYHGVPLVVIPAFFIDQYVNAKQLESTGSGIMLDFDNISEASVIYTVKTIISQPSFREAMQRQSKILRDNAMPPIDNAVYWIEYVLRHKGAPHLRTAAASLPWYKYFLIDVMAVLLASVILVLFIMYFMLRTIYRLLFGRSDKNDQNKVSKKKYN